MKNCILLLLVLYYSIGVICQTNQASQLQLKLDQVFAAVFAEDAPGGSVFIQKGSQVLYERSFGFADITTKEKFTPATLANLGSISKTFVAYGILLCQNKGKWWVHGNN